MKSKLATPAKRSPATKKGSGKEVLIVAIGASAGGLEAITSLLLQLSPNTGMAFIYVQHLSPDHKSILTTLLSKCTKMKVQEVTNKVLIKADHVYVIPPDKEMALLDGHIQLSPRTKERVVHLPIDTFFSSLAEKHKENAIGVILSGSGSDGTRGLLAIKEAGGLTFAQDDSAKFKSMPNSAITAGAVDLVLSPIEIAQELTRMSESDLVRSDKIRPSKESEIINTSPDLKIILNLLFKQTGVDFSHYKMPTIKRRILRRMLLNKIKSLKEYVKLATEHHEEINILYQDLLINVTNFFRDTDAHQYLKTTIFPKLLKSKTGNEKLRIWVPACATGEEAYSIAMTILEIQSARATNTTVQIFATDLSLQAIDKARIGEYGKHELEMVSPKRLQRFYTKSGSKYRIAKIIREMCVFAPHNILRDPPFSRVDFISCCNLFIYLDTTAQKKVLGTFHYALNEEGYLMLGKSESIGSSSQLFTHINNKFKIYLRKKNSAARQLPALQPLNPQPVVTRLKRLPGGAKQPKVINVGFDAEIDELLLSRFVPASVVINHSMEILQFRGETDVFLRHGTGRASLNLLKMTSPDIAFELRNSISIAIKTKQPVRKAGIEVKDMPALKMVTIEIIPLAIDWEEPLLMIIFAKPELVETFVQQGKDGKYNLRAKDRRIQKLEEDLGVARSEMNAFTQEQEAFTEELQSANEEVVSSNEELQSVNEELETSKEEIESTNEELTTTNQELQTRNELLNESYEYSEAIIATIPVPLVILDKELRVISANRVFYRTFGVNEEQTEGTLLYDLGNKQWNIPALRQFLEDILPKNTQFQDYEVTHNFPVIGEKIMMLNASRVVQKRHREQLILLAITDVTEQTIAHKRIEKSENKYRELSVSLEQKVKERTEEIIAANGALKEKNNELQHINKELQSFTYVASHDLQEPLRKIQILADRISESETKNLSEKGVDYFMRMRSSAQRMQMLIQDILSFSQLTVADREFAIVNIKLIIEQVVNELKEVIDQKNARIEIGAICDIKVIPFQFHQLMMNLIGNALKFSNPAIPAKIVISSKVIKSGKLKGVQLPSLKPYCHISIRDNGMGFESKFNEKIFDVFQKLHSKDEFPGTGIGLAIVKKIVENHNGVITAKSELGKGATFDIYLPV